MASIWTGDERRGVHKLPGKPTEAHIDRDGSLLVTAYGDAPIQVHSTTGKPLFDGGETRAAKHALVGGEVVAVQLARGGIATVASSPKPRILLHLADHHGSIWKWNGCVVTPSGTVRILNLKMEDADTTRTHCRWAVQHLAFINRSPELLVFDEDGVLAHYDLTDSVQKGTAAQGRDILSINVPVDRVWDYWQPCSITPSQWRAVFPTLIDLHTAEVTAQVQSLHRDVEVDVEHRKDYTARTSGRCSRLTKGNEIESCATYRTMNGFASAPTVFWCQGQANDAI